MIVRRLFMSTMIRPSTAVGGAARIAGKLGAAILGGTYKPHDLVPGEIELCRRFGASRTVVREAFKLLAAKGLIAPRKRVGTYARAREEWHMRDADVLAWRRRDGEAEPKLVFDLRQARGQDVRVEHVPLLAGAHVG